MKKTGFVLILIVIFLSMLPAEAKAEPNKSILKTNIEYPLVEINYFIVDSQENFYFKNTFFKQIQVYDNEARFLYALKIDTSRRFIFFLSKDDQLVIAFDNGAVWVVDKSGTIVEEKSDPKLKIYSLDQPIPWFHYKTPENNDILYSFNEGFFGISTFVKEQHNEVVETYDIHYFHLFLVSGAVFLVFGIIVFIFIIAFLNKYIEAKKQGVKKDSNVRFKDYSYWVRRNRADKKWNDYGMIYIEKDFKKHEVIRYIITNGSLLAMISIFYIIILNIDDINYFAADLYLAWVLIGLITLLLDRTILAYRFTHNQFIRKDQIDPDACPVCHNEKPDFWSFILNIKDVDLKCYYCETEYEEIPKRNRIITLAIAFVVAVGLAFALFLIYFARLFVLSFVWAYATWHIIVLLLNLRYFKVRFKRFG